MNLICRSRIHQNTINYQTNVIYKCIKETFNNLYDSIQEDNREQILTNAYNSPGVKQTHVDSSLYVISMLRNL